MKKEIVEELKANNMLIQQILARVEKSRDPELAHSGWMSDLVITKYLKPDKIDSKASEGMVLLAGYNKAGKEQNFLLSCLFIGFQ